MAVELEIQDGEPWWSSPYIWCVPGDDPTGTPSMPTAGEPCYVWAQVQNNGETTAENAIVRFYWANPSVGFNRTTATPIGTSYVTLESQEITEVLCLTPWVPEYVNQGHVCLLAEVYLPYVDPLPSTAAFNVPEDRHVAQRNLSLIQVTREMFSFPFEMHNPGRVPQQYALIIEQADLDELEQFEGTLGPDFEIPNEGDVDEVGFIENPCPSPEEVEEYESELSDIQVSPGHRQGFTLVGRLDGEAALLHVVQLVEGSPADGTVAGGLSVLLIQN